MPEPLPCSINSPLYAMITKHWPCDTFITPNMITVTGIAFSSGALYSLINEPCNWQRFGFLVLIRTVLDAMDGAVARKCKLTSRFGSQLDLWHDHVFAICVMVVCSYRAYGTYSNHKAYTLPVLCIILIVLLGSILESMQVNGTWASNDVVFKPVLYTSVAYLSSKCHS